MAIKEAAKKHGITISLVVGLLTTGMQTYQAHEKEKMLRERNEIFFSDYQDKIECQLDSLKIKPCR